MSDFLTGISRLKRTAPLPEVDDAPTGAAYELREARTHSLRAVDLLLCCWKGYAEAGGECDPEEAVCLLAAVDDAARAARAMLSEMGQSAAVERWAEATERFAAQTKPRGRPATGTKGKGKR